MNPIESYNPNLGPGEVMLARSLVPHQLRKGISPPHRVYNSIERDLREVNFLFLVLKTSVENCVGNLKTQREELSEIQKKIASIEETCSRCDMLSYDKDTITKFIETVNFFAGAFLAKTSELPDVQSRPVASTIQVQETPQNAEEKLKKLLSMIASFTNTTCYVLIPGDIGKAVNEYRELEQNFNDLSHYVENNDAQLIKRKLCEAFVCFLKEFERLCGRIETFREYTPEFGTLLKTAFSEMRDGYVNIQVQATISQISNNLAELNKKLDLLMLDILSPQNAFEIQLELKELNEIYTKQLAPLITWVSNEEQCKGLVCDIESFEKKLSSYVKNIQLPLAFTNNEELLNKINKLYKEVTYLQRFPIFYKQSYIHDIKDQYKQCEEQLYRLRIFSFEKVKIEEKLTQLNNELLLIPKEPESFEMAVKNLIDAIGVIPFEGQAEKIYDYIMEQLLRSDFTEDQKKSIEQAKENLLNFVKTNYSSKQWIAHVTDPQLQAFYAKVQKIQEQLIRIEEMKSSLAKNKVLYYKLLNHDKHGLIEGKKVQFTGEATSLVVVVEALRKALISLQKEEISSISNIHKIALTFAILRAKTAYPELNRLALEYQDVFK